ncbi:hypothetical protein ACIQ1H_01105 [Lysinibacillus sp. NPDC097279]|uniref:hypothetical protein n=1 Tax=Lysinibacillus sp. NPDC097279 TaxID=3364143 RepID=UPI0037FF30C3
MREQISENEHLYRKVSHKPLFWKPEINRPSSALFKDSNGVSVDRKMDREIPEIISFMETTFGKDDIKAVVQLSVEDCSEIGVVVYKDPIENNPYHAEIHPPDLKKPLAKKLAKACVVVYQSDCP